MLEFRVVVVSLSLPLTRSSSEYANVELMTFCVTKTLTLSRPALSIKYDNKDNAYGSAVD